MNISRRIIPVLYLLLLPAFAIGQNSGDSRSTEEDVNRIIGELSVKENLDELIQDLQNQFSQNPFGLPPEQNERMMEQFDRAFTADTLLSHIRRNLHRNYDDERMEAVMQWLENDDTQDVLDAREEFYTLQGIRKRIISRYEMDQDPPSEERMAVMDTLAKRMSSADTEIEINTVIFRAVVTAFSELNAQQSFSKQQIEGFVENYRNQLQADIDGEIVEQLLIMYYELDNDPLERFGRFYQTETGKWLKNMISESVIMAYKTASVRFLELIRN